MRTAASRRPMICSLTDRTTPMEPSAAPLQNHPATHHPPVHPPALHPVAPPLSRLPFFSFFCSLLNFFFCILGGWRGWGGGGEGVVHWRFLPTQPMNEEEMKGKKKRPKRANKRGKGHQIKMEKKKPINVRRKHQLGFARFYF